MAEGVLRHPWALFIVCTGIATGCGPSQREIELTQLTRQLRGQLGEQRQLKEDLKLRAQLAEARGRVLIGLVQGLTAPDPREASEIEASLEPARDSLAALDADLAHLVESVRHSRKDIAAMRAQRDALERELGKVKTTLELAQRAQASERSRNAELSNLLKQLTALITERSLQVEIVGNRMLLRLPDEVLFASNDARVLRQGKVLLDRVADALQAAIGRDFQIEGHTDALPVRYGRYRDNWRLSAERALNVMQYLVMRGVPQARLSAAAYADTKPIASEPSPEAQRRNRRIEIVVLPKLDELPDLTAFKAALDAREANNPNAADPAQAPSPPPANLE